MGHDAIRAAAAVLSFLALTGAPATGQRPSPPVASPAAEAVDAPFTLGISDAASLRAVVDGRIARARQLLDELLAVTAARTVANTLVPYDELMAELYTAGSEARLIFDVHPDEAMRKAGEELNRTAT